MPDLNNIAVKYDSMHTNWKGLQSIVRRKEFFNFLEFSNNRKEVIEIGIGDGIFTKLLAQSFDKVIAVDASKEAISMVKSKLSEYSNIEYVESYIEDFKLNKKVDNIIASHILEHVDEPQVALINIKKHLHKDSVLYVSVPNAMSLHRQVAVKMGLQNIENELINSDIDLGHKRVYYPDLFLNEFKKADFEIIKFGGVLFKPLSNSQIEKLFTEEMIQGFLEVGESYPHLCGEIYTISKLKG